MEIDLCKYVHLKKRLAEKIEEEGYGTVTLEDIHKITMLRLSPYIKGFIGMKIIENPGYRPTSSDLEMFESVSLMMLYRRELEEFMFNFPKIFKKYHEYSQENIKFSGEYTLSHYIFYQGAKKTQRIDVAYLNVVKMISK